MTRSKTLLVLVALMVVVAALNSAVWATTITSTTTVDPQLQIGPCTAGFPNCGGSPNTITGTLVDIYDNGAANQPLADILLLTLAIPTSVYSGTAPTATSTVTESGTDTGTATITLGADSGAYSGTWTSGGSAGTFDSSFNPPKGTPDALYAFIGFNTPDGGSYNLTNFNAAETAAGITGGSYAVLVYAINLGTLTYQKGDTLAIDFSSLNALPSGTIVGAYGCVAADVVAGPPQTCPEGSEAVPVWTTAGFVNSTPIPFIPEPASLAMLGSGLLTLGFVLRRKLRP